MSATLRLTLAQVAASPSPAVNLDKATRAVSVASQQGADLVIFPEMFMALPGAGRSLPELAEPPGGPFVSRMAALAREHGTALVCPVWETLPDELGRVANVAVVIASDGTILARYQKLHLFDALGHQESAAMQAGSDLPELCTIQGFTLGLAICYDLRFPELFRYQALRGADAILVPAAWYGGPMKVAQWQTLLRARAIENTIYTVGVNFCSSPFAAHSVAYGPFGEVVAELGPSENLSTVLLEHGRIDEIRKEVPSLQHCRRELFTWFQAEGNPRGNYRPKELSRNSW